MKYLIGLLSLCFLGCNVGQDTSSERRVVFPSTDSLNLSDLRLKDLPLDSFENKEITYLNLLGNAELDLYKEEKLLNSLPLLTDLRVSVDSLGQIPLSLRGKVKGVELIYHGINFAKELASLADLKYFAVFEGISGGSFLTMRKIPDELYNLTFLEELKLPGLGMEEISPKIKKLQYLKTLDLHSNSLSELPKEFDRLNNLEELNLQTNEFKIFPKVLYHLSGLKRLYLLSNYVQLPVDISKCSSLEELSFSKFYGSKIPDQFCELKALKSLTLRIIGDKKITEKIFFPFEFSKLTALETIDLSHCNVEEIPEVFFQIHSLKSLILRKNYINKIPKQIANLSKLEVLDVWSNPIESFPEEITTLTNLRYLNIGETKIKEIPSSVAKLKNIETLEVPHSIKGYNYELLLNFPKLKGLSLAYRGLKDIPKSVFTFKNLTYLNLRGNQIQEIPDDIEKLKQLTSLDISFNKLDKISANLSELVNINEININGNPDSAFESLCASFSSYNRPVYITTRKSYIPFYKFGLNVYVDTNLTVIPEEIGNLKNLRELNLSGSKVSKIPNSIEKCVGLKILNLGHTRLTGIDLNIGKVKNLTSLNLAMNEIKVIPAEICSLQSLESLSLASNAISRIPTEIDKMESLQSLDLSNNKISFLPVSLAKLSNLKTLNVDRNLLAVIPSELLNNLKITEFTFHNNQLTNKTVYKQARRRNFKY